MDKASFISRVTISVTNRSSTAVCCAAGKRAPAARSSVCDTPFAITTAAAIGTVTITDKLRGDTITLTACAGLADCRSVTTFGKSGRRDTILGLGGTIIINIRSKAACSGVCVRSTANKLYLFNCGLPASSCNMNSVLGKCVMNGCAFCERCLPRLRGKSCAGVRGSPSKITPTVRAMAVSRLGAGETSCLYAHMGIRSIAIDRSGLIRSKGALPFASAILSSCV